VVTPVLLAGSKSHSKNPQHSVVLLMMLMLIVLQCPFVAWCCQYWGVAFWPGQQAAFGVLHDRGVPQTHVHGYLTCAWICCRLHVSWTCKA